MMSATDGGSGPSQSTSTGWYVYSSPVSCVGGGGTDVSLLDLPYNNTITSTYCWEQQCGNLYLFWFMTCSAGFHKTDKEAEKKINFLLPQDDVIWIFVYWKTKKCFKHIFINSSASILRAVLSGEPLLASSPLAFIVNNFHNTTVL